MKKSALLIGAVLFAVATVPAQGLVSISAGPTKNMNCSGGVCTATALHAVLNVSDLTNMLASGNLRVVSGAQAMDIDVFAAFSWVSGKRLTLDANRSIAFMRPVTVAGAGSLTLLINDGGRGGDYTFTGNGSVAFWDLNSSLMINGTAFTLVGDIATLSQDILDNPSGHYALAQSFSSVGTYTNSPVQRPFTGTFEGLGNSITGLRISGLNADQDLGLFLTLGAGGVIRDLTFLRANVGGISSGNVGAIAAHSFGTIQNSQVGGHIFGQNAANLGGLVGFNDTGSAIIGSTVSAKVVNQNTGSTNNGGLAGRSDGMVRSSLVTGMVKARCCSTLGGLIGYNTSHGNVSLSHATGPVRGYNTPNVGGLIGRNDGTIAASFASGYVTGGVESGGLVGFNTGTVSASHASGSVKPNYNYGSAAGGLVAQNSGLIRTSYATGPVTSFGPVGLGGLVGGNTGQLKDCYATGAITTAHYGTDGGLVAGNQGTIVRVYSTGLLSVGGDTFAGGLIGVDQSYQSISAAYWDLDTSGISHLDQGAGSPPNDPGITGLSDAQLKSALPAGFASNVWGQSAGINNGYPYLLQNPPQ